MTTIPAHTSGPLDRLFLTYDCAAGFLMDFDGTPPDRAKLTARVLHRAGTLPALGLVPPTPGRQRWHPRTEALHEPTHLRYGPALTPGQDLDAATSALLRHPLPSAPHPPWDLWLLDDPAHRRFRICYRVHHALQDGAGAAHSMLALLADRPAIGPHPHHAVLPTVRGTLTAGRTVLRALLRPPRTWPALQAPPSNDRQWTCQDVPEPHVRHVAASHGATTNDVCLAALAQALRHWHHTHLAPGRPCADLAALLPLSLRQEHERHTPGNRVTAHHLTLPCAAPHFDQAIARVQDQTHVMRATRVRDASRLALRLLPPWLGEHAGKVLTARKPAPVIASSMTFPDSVTCLGTPPLAAAMFGDLYDQRLCYISFTRAAGVIRCGLLYDNALPHAATLPRLWSALLTPSPHSSPGAHQPSPG